MMARASAFCLAAAMFAVAAAASAQEDKPPFDSILFSDDEAIAVKKAILDFERMKVTGSTVEEVTAVSEVPNIFVSAVADYGEGKWTVWANGYRVTPQRQPTGFTVVSVSGESAEILVGGSSPAHVTLRPYQTWRARTNDVVEGIIP
jgi:hypothetical protein